MAFWIELHCDAHDGGTNKYGELKCDAQMGDQPAAMSLNTLESVSKVRRDVIDDAKRRGYRKIDGVWYCPACLNKRGLR